MELVVSLCLYKISVLIFSGIVKGTTVEVEACTYWLDAKKVL